MNPLPSAVFQPLFAATAPQRCVCKRFLIDWAAYNDTLSCSTKPISWIHEKNQTHPRVHAHCDLNTKVCIYGYIEFAKPENLQLGIFAKIVTLEGKSANLLKFRHFGDKNSNTNTSVL